MRYVCGVRASSIFSRTPCVKQQVDFFKQKRPLENSPFSSGVLLFYIPGAKKEFENLAK
jgi:hypothetical protein